MIHRASRARAVRAQGYLRQHANHTRLDLPLFIISSFQGGKKSEIRFFTFHVKQCGKQKKRCAAFPARSGKNGASWRMQSGKPWAEARAPERFTIFSAAAVHSAAATRGCGNRRAAAVQAASEHTAQNAKPVLFQAAAHTPRASPRCPARFGVSGPGAGAFHYFLGSSRSQRGGGRAGAEIDAQRPRKQQVNTRRRMQSPSFFKQRHTRRKPHRAARHASASPCAPVHGVRAARRRSPSLRGIFTTYSR